MYTCSTSPQGRSSSSLLFQAMIPRNLCWTTFVFSRLWPLKWTQTLIESSLQPKSWKQLEGDTWSLLKEWHWLSISHYSLSKDFCLSVISCQCKRANQPVGEVGSLLKSKFNFLCCTIPVHDWSFQTYWNSIVHVKLLPIVKEKVCWRLKKGFSAIVTLHFILFSS